MFYFIDKAIRPSHASEGCCSILWRAREFPYSNTARRWPRWEICYVRWMLFQWYYFFTFLFENSDLVILGGEDCKLRIWSIKSGELLLEDKFSNSVLTTVCYQSFKSNKHDILLPFLLSILYTLGVIRSSLRVVFLSLMLKCVILVL